MRVRKYVGLIKDVNEPVEALILLLKNNGASEGEAVLALMVKCEITLDFAQQKINESQLYSVFPSRMEKLPKHKEETPATRPGSARA